MHVRKLSATAILTLAFASTFSLAKSEDANALWKIQKTLASKKYVDLTHEFEPGIPRWPGFPDKTRKTIYWYDKRPDTLEVGFFSELFIRRSTRSFHQRPKGRLRFSRSGVCDLAIIDPSRVKR